MKKTTTAAPRLRSQRTVWLAVLLLLLLLFLLMLGKAANSSRPGDVLYGLDRGFEKLGVLFTPNPKARALHELQLFNERQTEAEQLVVGSNSNTCDLNYTPGSDTGNAEAVITALNLANGNLQMVGANLAQINNPQEKEDVSVEVSGDLMHHMMVWEALSKFAPKQTESTLLETTQTVDETLALTLAAISEGRRQDILNGMQFDQAQVMANIQEGYTICDGARDADESGAEGTDGSGTNSGTGTGSQTETGTGTGTSTTRPGSTGATGNTGASGGTGTGGSNGTNPSGRSGFNINANTDSGVNVDVGIDEQGQIKVDPQINPNPNGGTGAEASVNENKILDTNACPGPVVLGVCVGN